MQARTYVMQSLQKGRLIRWPDNCMPLKFYIAPYRWYNSQGDDYKFRQMVIKALDTWASISRGKVRFELVNTLHESQINLDWKRVDRQALGHCYFNFDNASRLYSAEVQIGISDGLLHQEYMNDGEIYHTILHEIGHSIGLGHSPYKTDIMYTPHQYGVVNPSSNDSLTVQWLYNFPYGLAPEEIAKNYSFGTSNLDEIIFKRMNNQGKSKFEDVKNSIKVNARDLEDEQIKLAQLKKYHLGLSQVKLPENVKNYIRQQHKNSNE